MFKIFRLLISFFSGIFAGKTAKNIYKEDFEDCANTYDSVVTRPLLGKISEERIIKLEFPSHAKILELGCGTGQVTEFFLKHFKDKDIMIDACDVSGNMLSIAKNRCAGYPTKVNFIKNDMSEVLKASPAGNFDIVSSFWSLEYSKPSFILREASRTLKKGGKMVVLVNTGDTLAELQKLITPIILKNIFCLKNIPPIVVPKNGGWFKKTAEKHGFKTEIFSENVAEYCFTTGEALIDWIKKGGPCSGFRGALKAKNRDRIFTLISKETDKRCGLKVVFKYLYYVGVKK